MLTFVNKDPDNLPRQVAGSAAIHAYRLLRTYFSLPESFREDKANEKIVHLFTLLDGWMVTKAAAEVVLNATEGEKLGQIQDLTMYSAVISGIVFSLEIILSDVKEFTFHYVNVVEEEEEEINPSALTPQTFQ